MKANDSGRDYKFMKEGREALYKEAANTKERAQLLLYLRGAWIRFIISYGPQSLEFENAVL